MSNNVGSVSQAVNILCRSESDGDITKMSSAYRLSSVRMITKDSAITHSVQEFLVIDRIINSVNSDMGQASVEALRREHLADYTLARCWALAERNKGC
jgi:hypothetical protein